MSGDRAALGLALAVGLLGAGAVVLQHSVGPAEAFAPQMGAAHHVLEAVNCGDRKILVPKGKGGLFSRNPLNTAHYHIIGDPRVCIFGGWTPTVDPVPVIFEPELGVMGPLYVDGPIAGHIEVRVAAMPALLPSLLVDAPDGITEWSVGEIPAGTVVVKQGPGRLFLTEE
jgi:hypothetical protein